MKKIGKTRIKVAEVLTELFGRKEKGVVFLPENTTKKAYSGERLTPCEQTISSNWSAQSEGVKPIFVLCVGMTMTSFLKEYEKRALLFTQGSYGTITIYKDTPQFKTSGFVVEIDKTNDTVALYISALGETIRTRISDQTPSWLLIEHEKVVAFSCRIHQYWRSSNQTETFDWSKVWPTFHATRRISKEETKFFM